jgi:hypothetical protein
MKNGDRVTRLVEDEDKDKGKTVAKPEKPDKQVASGK